MDASLEANMWLWFRQSQYFGKHPHYPQAVSYSCSEKLWELTLSFPMLA